MLVFGNVGYFLKYFFLWKYIEIIYFLFLKFIFEWSNKYKNINFKIF